MNKPNPIPHPGYTTDNPFIPALSSLFLDLGAQDACIQLQEIAVIHLEKSALAMNAQMPDFLKLLYISNSVPQGTYSFSDMRAQIYNSFISATYSIFERSLKECIAVYKAKNQLANWVTQIGSAKLDPLSQILHNCTPSERNLLSVPEKSLFDYYRKVRVADNHVSASTATNASAAFTALTSVEIAHFQNYAYIFGAPHPPGTLTFHDFRLYTRAIKYYANLLNEVCA